jgi:ribulose-phosphate 3-epimerase
MSRLPRSPRELFADPKRLPMVAASILSADFARLGEECEDAGADHLTFHIEVEPDPAPLAAKIREAGLSVGVAINPETPVDRILSAVEVADLLLVMSVHPGFSGQAFIPAVLSKASRLAPMLRSDQRLEIDGGVTAATAVDCRAHGVDVLVTASALFGSKDYAAEIAAIRGQESGVPAPGPVGA